MEHSTDLWWYHLNEAPNGGVLKDDELRRSFFSAVGAEFQCDVVAKIREVDSHSLAGAECHR